MKPKNNVVIELFFDFDSKPTFGQIHTSVTFYLYLVSEKLLYCEILH